MDCGILLNSNRLECGRLVLERVIARWTIPRLLLPYLSRQQACAFTSFCGGMSSVLSSHESHPASTGRLIKPGPD
ncbi:putative glutathione-dependent formaldehyde-activating enzyme [Fusarium oxysporum f. sp. albedinis]|nr:putative glutathione-dependent formaldehyde-activating enzyme [Fusarium oxysporum f. sp. albedinis]